MKATGRPGGGAAAALREGDAGLSGSGGLAHRPVANARRGAAGAALDVALVLSNRSALIGGALLGPGLGALAGAERGRREVARAANATPAAPAARIAGAAWIAARAAQGLALGALLGPLVGWMVDRGAEAGGYVALLG